MQQALGLLLVGFAIVLTAVGAYANPPRVVLGWLGVACAIAGFTLLLVHHI